MRTRRDPALSDRTAKLANVTRHEGRSSDNAELGFRQGTTCFAGTGRVAAEVLTTSYKKACCPVWKSMEIDRMPSC